MPNRGAFIIHKLLMFMQIRLHRATQMGVGNSSVLLQINMQLLAVSLYCLWNIAYIHFYDSFYFN